MGCSWTRSNGLKRTPTSVTCTRALFEGFTVRHKLKLSAPRMLVSYGANPSLVGAFVRPLSSSVEHFLGKEEVVGSIPTGGSVIRECECQPDAMAG